MTSYSVELQQYKNKIPDFIMRLYHILSSQYNQYLSWHGDSQIVIKNCKKLEEQVLPNFFRHSHLSSFIRQLNMYKFKKINKVDRLKHHLYFRNDLFKRGQIQKMTKITRNTGKSKTKNKQELLFEENISVENDAHSISISHQLQQNNALQAYKQYVKNIVNNIAQNLKQIESKYPPAKQNLQQAIIICNQLIETRQLTNVQTPINESLQSKNMMSTMLLFPGIESLIFSSQCSFYQLN